MSHPNMIRNNNALGKMPDDEIFNYFPSGRKFKSSFKRELWKSHDKKCCYCGCCIETHIDMHIDHYIPKVKNGGDDLDNIVCSCAKCNLIKRDRDLEEFRFCLAVSNSIFSGIVQAGVLSKIVSLGVDLPIELKPFYFEELLRSSNE